MKKIFTISSIALAVLLSASCSEDRLDFDNPNALVAQTAWNTQADVESGLTGCYHTLYNSFWDGDNAFIIDGQSDEFYSQSPDADAMGFINLVYANYDQRWNTGAWNYLYQGAFRCNQVITYADQVEWDSEENKNLVLAQARMIRAMDYYYLAMLYKKAPIVDWISKPDDKPAESTFEQLCDFVEQDLLFAEQHLPSRANFPATWKGQYGRMHKDVATMFLGKLYMNSGHFDKALPKFKSIIDGGQYKLVANYKDNFRHDTENNSESIFETQNSVEVDTWGGFFTMPNDGSQCCFASWRERFMGPSPFGFADYSVADWVVDMYKDEKDKDGNWDIRLHDNVGYPDMFKDFPGDVVYQDITEWDFSAWKELCWCRKYTQDYFMGAGHSAPSMSEINQRILRYADVLLSYAECLVETQGESAIPEATKYVNMIRERANLYPLAESVHKADLNSLKSFKKRLRIEREKELCFEYDRYFDLRRYGLGTDDEYTQSVKDRAQKFRDNFKPGHQWMPIPLAEVDNNPNLAQNEGY